MRAAPPSAFDARHEVICVRAKMSPPITLMRHDYALRAMLTPVAYARTHDLVIVTL